MAKWEPTSAAIRIVVTSIGHGIIVYAAFAQDFVAPVAMIWGIEINQCDRLNFHIYHAYTLPECRLMGLFKLVLDCIKKRANVVTTGGGSSELLTKTGFLFEPKTGLWWLTGEKPAEKK
jgi:hypothetical protein